MKKTVLIVFLFFHFTLFCGNTANNLIQKVDDGFIDWTDLSITVTGSGVPDLSISNPNSAKLSAEKAAKINARYRFMRALGKIELGNGKRLEKYLAEIKDVAFLNNISRNVQWDSMTLKNQYSDGSVEYLFKFGFSLQLSEIINKTKEAFIKPSPEVSATENMPVNADKKDFLVVDLTKVQVSPMLFPSVQSADGENFFNLKKVSEPFKVPGGFYRIRKSAESILSETGAEKEYLKVTAVKIKNGTEIIVSKGDAIKIKTMLKPEVLSEGKVVLIFK